MNQNQEPAEEGSEYLYKTLLDTAPLCIKLFDAQGNLVSVNKGAREEHFLLDKSDEEIKHWKYMDCIEEKYHDLVKESMKKALEGESSEFDMEHVPGTSTGHWCHSSLAPAKDKNGNFKYILFISKDVTSEKEAEIQKDENIKELKKLNQLMIDRELKMIELKEENRRLTNQRYTP